MAEKLHQPAEAVLHEASRSDEEFAADALKSVDFSQPVPLVRARSETSGQGGKTSVGSVHFWAGRSEIVASLNLASVIARAVRNRQVYNLNHELRIPGY